MNSAHWLDDRVEWLRYLVPELQDDRLYIRSDSELHPSMACDNSIAYTSQLLDLQMHSDISHRGLWQGRGHGIVVSSESFFALSPERQRAVLLHELAHCLDGGKRTWPESSELSELDRLAAEPGALAKLCNDHGCGPGSDYYLRSQKIHHGMQFARIGLHLWWRCRYEINVVHCGLFRDGYGSQALEFDAVEALHPELETGGNLFEILQAEPPSEFAELFAK